MTCINFKLIIFFLFGCLVKSYGQEVYSLDGHLYGDRKEIINSQVNELKSQNLSVLKFGGKEIPVERMCSCIVDLMPFYNYQEFKDNEKNGKLLDLFNSNNNLKIFIECVDKNFSNDYDVDYSQVKKLGVTGTVKQNDKNSINNCVQNMNEINKRDNLNLTNNWIKDFCECQISKIKSSNYSVDEIQNPKNGGKYHKEVILKCIEFAYESSN